VLASTVPTCQAYDPAFAYELGAIVHRGLERMYGGPDGTGESVVYYLTVYNENYEMPARPDGVTDADIVSGLYRWAAAPDTDGPGATIVFSGTAHLAARRAQAELADRYGIGAELWSATSYKALREDALSTERWNRLHPLEAPRAAEVTSRLATSSGPIVAVTDFMKAVPDQVARFVPAGRSFTPLGTDGFGRSDTREALRRFFETDAAHVEVAVLSALATAGEIDPALVAEAVTLHGLEVDTPDPRTR
jgi:pyruvate dehydrogenase E1 component